MVQTRAAAKRKAEGEEVKVSDPVGLTKRGRRGKPGPSNESDENQVAQSSDSAQPRKKRRRGKRGELCQLNLDVLFLIAAYIHPVDLLNLARTCKSLRELLMSSASEFVWKTARRQVNVPACPADLTEPQYANLLYCARCHGCVKQAKKVLWQLRRRYCEKCRKESLTPLTSCQQWMRDDVLPTEHLTIGSHTTYWVETEQMKSVEEEYERTSDKDKFLSERRDQVRAMRQHADKCFQREMRLAEDRRWDLQSRRDQRREDIFLRLRQLGFQREIAYYSESSIKSSNIRVFRTSKPLTDKEWAQIWPEWQHKMDNLRLERLEQTVFPKRQELLEVAYDEYVANPSSWDTLPFCLPPVNDLARLPPFEEIIKVDEGAQISDELFASAFEKLPELVDEWKRLDIELAELVKIPSHLSFQGSPNGPAVASYNIASEAVTQRLQLACAVFSSQHLGTYQDVLHFGGSWFSSNNGSPQGILSDISFLKDAPYIIHARGLDPNVATPEDMDHRNARIICLTCNDGRVLSWRNAMLHAESSWSHTRDTLLESQWQVVCDEHMDAILAAESEAHPVSPSSHKRCMLCLPRVGDELCDIKTHLRRFHNIEADAQEGVHYMRLGIPWTCCVKMVKEGERVTFIDANQYWT